MFGVGTATLLAILLVVSILSRQEPLFLLSLALLVAAGLSRLWEKRCLTGLEYHRRLSTRHARFGENVELEIEIVNRKILPLSWLEIEDEIPRALPPSRGTVVHSHKPDRSLPLALVGTRW